MGIDADTANLLTKILGDSYVTTLDNVADIIMDPNVEDKIAAIDIYNGVALDGIFGEGLFNLDVIEGGNVTAIRDAYETTLGRAATDEEITYWDNQGAFDPEAFLAVADPELLANQYLNAYRTILGREPSTEELNSWTASGPFNEEAFRQAAQAELGG
jgi:hypothetical protein